MILEVIQTERYVFEVPTDKPLTDATAEDWFTGLRNPVAEADEYEVTNRTCYLSPDAEQEAQAALNEFDPAI